MCLSNVAFEKIKEAEPKLVEELESKGVRYSLVFPDKDDCTTNNGRGWQSAYLTNNKENVEEIIKEQGASFEWLSGGSLKTTSTVLPPIRTDPRTGKKNMVQQYSRGIFNPWF